MVDAANVARIDPALGVRVVGWRDLRYSDASRLGEDRPNHVRAASGLAHQHGRLAVIQDDTAFIGMVAGDEVAALVLPRGKDGRRRYEVGLGNKHEKQDLECCIAIGDDLYAFGSGSTHLREKIVHVGYATQIIPAGPLYRKLREELGSAINIEGIAAVRDELWLFHRGNTGRSDRGPAIVRFARDRLMGWIAGESALPEPLGYSRYDLGDVAGVRLGFTDAVAVGERVFYIAAAEDSPNAIDDGRVLASHLGVIDRSGTRAAPLEADGALLKAEGLAFDPVNPRHAWVATDPDDVAQPSRLYELELVGPW